MTDVELAPSTDVQRQKWGRWTAIFLLVVLAVVPFMHPRGEQQSSRYAATAAVWDLGTLEVIEYGGLFGRDGAVVEDAVYTDKAPGQPFLAVPFYGVFRLAGGEPLSEEMEEPNLGLWWLTVWSAGIPLAVLAVLMYRWSWEIGAETALFATLTITFGTLLLVYGSLLFAHVLAALLGFAMFLLVRRRPSPSSHLFMAGALGGLVVLTENPMALIVIIVMAAAFAVNGARAWRVVVGGLPFALLLGLYNTALFGSPITFSYQWSVFSGVRNEARGTFEAFSGLSLDHVSEVLLAERGLFIATPVVAMAIIGCWLLWKRGFHIDASVALLAFGAMLSIQLFWPNAFAGGAGPRYVTPGLPFLVAPLALAWKRWRILTSGLAVLSSVTMALAIATKPQLGENFEAGLRYWVSEVFAGNLAPTIYTEWMGAWGWLVHIATAVLAFTAVFQLASRSTAQSHS